MSRPTADLKSVFAAALEQDSPAERAAFLDSACGEDAELRQQIDKLLAAYDDAGSFLERPVLELTPTEVWAESHTDSEHVAASAADATLFEDSDEMSLDFLEPSATPGRLGILGSYEIVEVIGRGGMGVVLRAIDTRLNRVVAVKVLAPEYAANPNARRRFAREAQAAAAVAHPHVVTIHAVEPTGSVPYLVMEYVGGQSLKQKLDRVGPLEVKEVLRIGSQIASGLAAAHRQGLMHRDIKPANILLENGVERVKITDFGLARAVDDVGLTKTGDISGTPQYMSPEQAGGESVDHRSDLFSLGSVLYTMCTGRSPFRADTTIAVIRRVCDDQPRPIREVNPDVPKWFCEIIDRLLAKSPDDRFQTAAEVSDLLNAHLAHLQQPATTPRPVHTWREDVACSFREQKVPVAERAVHNRDIHKRKWTAAAVWLVVLIGLGATEATGVTRMVPTVIRIVRGEGTLVVTVDEPGVSVTVDGEDIVITGAGVQEIRVRPGRHRIQARKGGLILDAGTFTVERGGRRVVHIDWEEPDTPSAAKRQAAPPDRAAAVQFGEWRPLFDGRTLAGWKTRPEQPDGWHVANGVLAGAGRVSHLFTERGDYADFALRFEVRLNEGGNSGVFLRAPFEFVQYRENQHPNPKGYELQLVDGNHLDPREMWISGSLIPLAQPSGANLIHADQWYTVEVTAVGSRFEVWVDSVRTVSVDDPQRLFHKGHIVLQCWTRETRVEFRKIEICEVLPAADQPARPRVDLAQWGTFVDPFQNCRLVREERAATIHVPGKRLPIRNPLVNRLAPSPYLVQQVEGDFLIEVEVPPFDRPLPNTAIDGTRSWRAAGLLVWQDELTFLRLERSCVAEFAGGMPYVNAEWHNGRNGQRRDTHEMLPDATHLQIERQGTKLILRIRREGEAWRDWRTVTDLDLAEKVVVGIVSINATTDDFAARFENFAVQIFAAATPEISVATPELDAITKLAQEAFQRVQALHERGAVSAEELRNAEAKWVSRLLKRAVERRDLSEQAEHLARLIQIREADVSAAERLYERNAATQQEVNDTKVRVLELQRRLKSLAVPPSRTTRPASAEPARRE